jgi:[protein-PII] uridylyltransferase
VNSASALTFSELVRAAETDPAAYHAVDKRTRLRTIQTHYQDEFERIRAHHRDGASGRNVIMQLTALADYLVRGIVRFGLSEIKGGEKLRSRIAICALGGYGRGELNPYSDIDLCLIYSGRLDSTLKQLNEYLVPMFWDVGFKMGYVMQEVSEAVTLAGSDLEVLTSYMHARLLFGDPTLFAKLDKGILKVQERQKTELLAHLRKRVKSAKRSSGAPDLYDTEPDIKENVGGLRDFHVALWIIRLDRGALTLDDLEKLGELMPEDNLHFQEGLDFIWRIRNELHFHSGKAENKLDFALQKHVARAFGYGGESRQAIDRFMQDYYTAARSMRQLLQIVVGITEASPPAGNKSISERGHLEVVGGELVIGGKDPRWFAENPPRLMEVIWACGRYKAPLAHATRELVKKNVHLVGDAFRENDLVRRFFVALCSRPLQAGLALREAAETGLLGAYIPEFKEVAGVVRYEDFHSFPVDEHTLRALEALAAIPEMEGPIGRLLQVTLDHMREPHVLVIAILCHDLGKAGGEEHVEEGVRLARTICSRIGLSEEDTERIVFLVEHHMVMNHIAMYRDIDDLDIISNFARTMRTADRMRALFVLSYADLSAVGPNVWTEWKGALLAKLYLKTEQILLGRAQAGDDYWTMAKAQAIEAEAPDTMKARVTPHLQQLGERYFIAFTPEQVIQHMHCIEEAQASGLAVRWFNHEETGTSDVVVCTRNRHGLFANLAGCFASQLIDVQRALVFTAPNGYVVDSFTVTDAMNRRPLTERQIQSLREVLQSVLMEGVPVQDFVARSKNRLFALHQPRVPVATRIRFDNTASRTDTVVDIETGDRTGLLYDIARIFAEHGVDIVSSHVVTDARQVRDSFYVRLSEAKIEDPAVQTAVRSELESAIRPLAVSDT